MIITAQSSMLTNRKKPINSTIKTSSGGYLTLANKQAAPKFSYAVWDEQGMVCILAKFEATLTITFYTPSGAHVNIPYHNDNDCQINFDSKKIVAIDRKDSNRCEI